MKVNYNLLKIQLRKKMNLFSIFVISLSICLILILCSYKASVQNSVNDSAEKLSFRSFSISSKSHEDSETKKILENIDHITNVTYAYYYQTSLKFDEFANDKLNGSFDVVSANNKSIPQIVKGTNFPDNDNYYLICPENFYPGNFDNYKEFSYNDRIDLDKYLNKELNIQAYGKNFNIKLIGISKNSDYNLDEYLCYANEKLLVDMMNTYYDSLGPNDSAKLENQTGFVINIDEAKNVDEVKAKLDELGYRYREMAYTSYKIINGLIEPVNKIVIAILILVFILIFILLEKDFQEDKNFYKLMSYLGYDNKYILKTYAISSVLKLLFCIAISIVLSVIGYIIFLIVLKYNPFIFGKYRLVIDTLSPIYVILVLIFTLGLSLILNKRNVGIHE